MYNGKFIVSGEDKATLTNIKSILMSSGHVFIGYSKEPFNILRHIRNMSPDLVLLEVNRDFRQLMPVLEVIDEELLAACVLILDKRDDAIFDFLKNMRVITFITKPVFEEAFMQIVDISLVTYNRIVDYEQKIKKMNETIESRRLVEKAKWILIEQDGVLEQDAYEIIKKKSRDNRVPMRDIANAIIMARGN